ncbi:AbrB/MazE/SpoVT family DNA-binding domain-containing protein [Sphingomonas sp. CV7422]|uniref:AbrB/MazE/SpoVT family DNA-binding domain-containing protein n=1 Tax=Sphingomonas sp. CV7422 TaxID=3018036 RepID=UPI0022FE9D81|nr:AbrB/MazE/SpoVT family DNA-binding domain-containing protein [Sphingomonas sp. CV7422]
MNAFVELSDQGQVVIPQEIRERLRLVSGDRLELIERSDGVFVRKSPVRSGDSFEAITARIRARVPKYDRSTSIEDMNAAVAEMWAQGGPHWDR